MLLTNCIFLWSEKGLKESQNKIINKNAALNEQTCFTM